jgi:hypothetical protein
MKKLVLTVGGDFTKEEYAKVIDQALTLFYSTNNEAHVNAKLKCKEGVERMKPVMETTAKRMDVISDIHVEDQYPEDFAVLELSTAHITQEDDEELMAKFDPRSGMMPLNYGVFEYGYAFMLTTDDQDPELEDRKSMAEEVGLSLSESFWNVLKYAKDNGYRCVYIDRDADTIEELETHDW